MYQLWKHALGECLFRIREGGLMTSIPYDPANTDYQAYLAWCAEGNEPELWEPESN